MSDETTEERILRRLREVEEYVHFFSFAVHQRRIIATVMAEESDRHRDECRAEREKLRRDMGRMIRLARRDLDDRYARKEHGHSPHTTGVAGE